VTAELFFVPGHVESGRAFRRLVELQARHPRRLRVVFRVVSRQAALVVPVATLEAYAQGKFHEFMDALVDHGGAVRREQLPALAEAAGVDPVRLEEALERALEPDRLPDALRANDRRRRRLLGVSANIPELTFNAAPPRQPLASLDAEELEALYQQAWEAAVAMMDEGVPPGEVLAESQRRRAPDDAIVAYPASALDDREPEDDPGERPPPLLREPLALAGLPSDGPADAPVVAVVLCNLRYVSCRAQLESVAGRLRELYPDELRLTWYPWYDRSVEGNEAAPRLHAAALCAERQGAGWKWLDEATRLAIRIGPPQDVAQAIELVAERAAVDRQLLDACLEEPGDPAGALVDAAVAAGVVAGPAVVLGGRLYLGGFTDWPGAVPMVETELAPGLLERLVPDRGADPAGR
jgi:hypothetical protein